MQVDFTLQGATPLLMHYDSVEWADVMASWRIDPANKARSVARDDRSPWWTWIGYLYHDGKHVSMPAQNIMACLLKAGGQVVMKRQTTYKSLTQSGLFIHTEHCKFFCADRQIEFAPILSAMEDADFEFKAAQGLAKENGFLLDVRRGSVGSSKHIRVRPRFDDWRVDGRMEVIADADIKLPTLKTIFEIAGSRMGLCDWRPSAPKKPGPYGRFTVDLKKVK